MIHGDEVPQKRSQASLLETLNTIAQKRGISPEQLVETLVANQPDQDDTPPQHYFDFAPDMLCIVNQHGYFVEVNPAFTRVLGYPTEDIKGKLFINFVHPDDRQATENIYHIIFEAGAKPYFENRYRRADGEYVWLSWNWVKNPDDPTQLYASARDITHLKQTESALENAYHRNTVILNSISDAFFALDSLWRFSYLNRQAEVLLQRPAKDLLDKHIWEEFPEAVGSEFYNAYHKVAEERVPVQFTAQYEPLHTWFEVSAYPSEDNNGVTVYFRDVSERKAMEHALHEAVDTLESSVRQRTTALTVTNDRLRREIHERKAAQQAQQRLVDILEATGDLVGIVDSDGTITYLNAAGLRLLGYTGDSLPEQLQIRDITPTWAYKKLVHEALNVAIREGIWMGETAILSVDGQEIPLSQVVIVHADDDGNMMYTSTIARDITVMKAHEESLRNALNTERELNEMKSHFMSMVSHEFRTPLTAIHSSADLLHRYGTRMDEEKRTSYLNQIRAQVKYLTEMIEEIRTLGRVREGKLIFQPEPVDFEEFCQLIVQEIGMTSGLEADLIVQIDGIAYPLEIDKTLMRQVLSNLLNNAAKYSDTGTAIHLTLSYYPSFLRIRVQDKGIGIPAEDHKHLYEIFYRGANVGTIQGTGIGLAIVKQGVDAHNGSITMQSDVDEGTTFTMTLPRYQPDA